MLAVVRGRSPSSTLAIVCNNYPSYGDSCMVMPPSASWLAPDLRAQNPPPYRHPR